MSKTYLVTGGGAGFIGSNFIHYILERHQDILVVNVDKLTYAGNLENLKAVMDDERYAFIQADVCDREAMGKLFEQYSIDYVVNFAAESHVDRSITDPGGVFVSTNVMGGTLNLLDAAKSSWKTGGDDSYREGGVRFLQVSTDEVYGSLGPEGGFFTETTPPLEPAQSLLGKQGLGRPPGESLWGGYIQASGEHNQVLEQLRALPVSREAHPADDQQLPEQAGGASRLRGGRYAGP